MCIVSCFYKDKYSNKEITKNCIDYIDFIRYNDIIPEDREMMLRVVEEFSKDSSYYAYRISSEPPYLPLKIIPSEFNYINGYPVIYFLDRNMTSKKEVSDEIKKAGIYNDDMAYMFKTNYPEWVMLYKRGDNGYKLIKSSWYRDLEDLIKLN